MSTSPFTRSGSLPGGRGREALVCLLLVLATLAVYRQVLGYGFVNYDDLDYVVENRNVQGGLTAASLRWALTTTHGSNWHPLTWLSHMADYRLFGADAGGHHLVNLLLHTACTLLLFGLFRTMTGAVWRSGFVAALFALHPLHVESVAWVSERKDVLSTFFWLLTTWAYLAWVRRRGLPRYLAVVLLFTLGLMSKPMLVTLPFVLLLLDLWPLGRLDPASAFAAGGEGGGKVLLRLVAEKLPLLALAAAASALTLWAPLHEGSMITMEAIPFGTRLANAAVSYGKYVVRFFVPRGLSVLYPYPPAIPAWEAALSALLLLSASLAALRAAFRAPWLTVGWFWFAGTLVPVIGLVQVSEQAMADRYTYVPFIGLSVAVAWGLPALLEGRRHGRALLAAAATVSVAAMAFGAWRQAAFWENSVTLLEHSLAVTSRNYLAHNNLAVALQGEGRDGEAVAHLRQALAIFPDYAMAHNNLGNALSAAGRAEEAEEHYRRALEKKADFEKTRYNLGLLLDKEGRTEEAVGHYLEALRIRPDYTKAVYSLAMAYARLGRVDEAVARYLEAIRLEPGNVAAHYNVGLLLDGQGRLEEAAAHYREVLRLDPGTEKAHFDLGFALSRLGRLEEAVDEYRRDLRGRPGEARTHYNLGLALEGLGRLEEAAAHYLEAVRLRPDYAEAHNNLGVLAARAGKADEAVSHFRRALAADPGYEAARRNLERAANLPQKGS